MEGKIIALVGKGGVGKTSLSALTIRILSEKYPDKKILAIDADSAIGLTTALGVEAKSKVDDIRKLFIQHAEDGDQKATIQLLGEAKFQIFDALIEKNNISFSKIGKFLIDKYHQLDFVKAIKIIFITKEDFDYQNINLLLTKSENITKKLDHLLNKVKMDCTSCSLQIVCNEVEKNIKKIFKNRISIKGILFI